MLQKLKDNLPVVAGVLIGAVIGIFIVYGNRNQDCGTYRDDKNVTIGTTTIQAQVTKTPAESQKGLGGRACIPADKGMLFGFTQPGYYPFWMKGMRFPIDIVWISSDHKVVGAVRNVQPDTYPHAFKNSTPAQYVLELKANRSNELKIAYGTVINF